MGTGIGLNTIIFLIILAASGIRWLLTQLAEARARKEAQEREQSRRDEILRTGRDPDASPGGLLQADEANARLREIAARRQAQLRELRRRQTEADGSPAPAPIDVLVPSAPTLAPTPPAPPPRRPMRPTVGPLPGPLNTGPTTPSTPPRPPRRAATPAPTPGRPPVTPAEITRAESRRRNAEARAAAEARQRAQQAAIREDQEVQRERRRAAEAFARRPSTDPAPRRPQPVALRGITDWRAAFLAAEVLAPPVSLRPPPGDHR